METHRIEAQQCYPACVPQVWIDWTETEVEGKEANQGSQERNAYILNQNSEKKMDGGEHQHKRQGRCEVSMLVHAPVSLINPQGVKHQYRENVLVTFVLLWLKFLTGRAWGGKGSFYLRNLFDGVASSGGVTAEFLVELWRRLRAQWQSTEDRTRLDSQCL